MYLQKVISRRTFFNKFSVGVFNVNDENSRIRNRTYPLVRGMDPRIRIHSKMSWIRNSEHIYNPFIKYAQPF